jgi:hypothetical protein
MPYENWSSIVKLAEYYESYDTNTKKREYFIEIYTVPWYLALWYLFWLKVDPCSKRPWRLWHPLTKLEMRAYTKLYRSPTSRVKVSRKWAKENYDWDIDEKPLSEED